MRFYEQYKGFIFEFNSIGEYFKTLLWRLLGSICGIAIVLIGVYLLCGVNLISLLFLD